MSIYTALLGQSKKTLVIGNLSVIPTLCNLSLEGLLGIFSVQFANWPTNQSRKQHLHFRLLLPGMIKLFMKNVLLHEGVKVNVERQLDDLHNKSIMHSHLK